MNPQKWEVYLVFFRVANPPKDKYFVVMEHNPVTGQALGFLINTLPRTQLNTPEMRPCSYTLSQSDHPFLSHESILTLHQHFAVMLADFKVKLGQIHSDRLDEIAEFARQCPALREKVKNSWFT